MSETPKRTLILSKEQNLQMSYHNEDTTGQVEMQSNGMNDWRVIDTLLTRATGTRPTNSNPARLLAINSSGQSSGKQRGKKWLKETKDYRKRTSTTRPISVPVSPQSAVKCYPFRQVLSDYSESRLFHGGDMARLPSRFKFQSIPAAAD